MGRLMMEEFCSRSPVFLNMTAGKNSVPGYRRMGFVPLADKVIYKRRGILRDLDALLRAVLKTPRDSRNVPLGEGRISFGRILQSH